MRDIAKYIIWIFIGIIFLRLFDSLIYPIPIEIRIKSLSTFIDILFPISIFCLSVFLLFRQINSAHKIRYLLIPIGVIGLLIGIVFAFMTRFISETWYEDRHIVYQSLDNKNDKIIQQYMDEGAMGSHWREVRVSSTFLGLRYSNRFCSTTLNGKWIYKENQSEKIDTLNFSDFEYKSQFNSQFKSSNRWTAKKCN